MPIASSKAARGYVLCSSVPALPVKAAAPGLTPAMSANVAFKTIIRNCVVHLQGNQEGMLLGRDPNTCTKCGLRCAA